MAASRVWLALYALLFFFGISEQICCGYQGVRRVPQPQVFRGYLLVGAGRKDRGVGVWSNNNTSHRFALVKSLLPINS